jgi:hypothetical protein
LTQLGKTLLDGLRQHAQDNHVDLPGWADDPGEIPPEQIVTVLGGALARYFPSLTPTSSS